MTSKGETLIHREKTTKISFDKKIANNGGEGFLLIAKFYKSTNDADISPPEKQNTEGKAAVHPKRKFDKKQGNKTTKKPHDIEKSYQKYPHKARPSCRR